MNIDLAALKQLASRATPGNWSAKPSSNGPSILKRPACPQDNVAIMDADYIAAAQPDVILALIERLEEAEAAQARSCAAIEAKALEDAAMAIGANHREAAIALCTRAAAIREKERDS